MNADRIILANALFTGLNDKAEPGALAVVDDRIVYAGPVEGAAAFQGSATRVKDYGDALIVPGFHDSHLHFFPSALYSSPLAMNYLGTSEADYVAHLAALAARRPAGSWLLAQGWREYRWDVPVLPSKHSLNAVYPNQPVALYSGDAHTLWVNSAALDALGITRESEPPAGGSYDRDDQGELTGIIREAAAMELMPRIVAAFSDEELCAAYRSFMDRLLANGITSVCDMSLMAMPGLDFVRDDLYEKLEDNGELAIRVHLFPTLLENLDRFEAMHRRFAGPFLRAPGLKQFFDGVSSQHTAWLNQPYANARFEGDCGRPTIEPATMRALVLSAAQKGYAVRIHAIGDEAIHEALSIFEEARRTFGPLDQGQNCLEHLENLQPADIARLAALDILAAAQPPHITLDPGGPERDLGSKRTPYMWPFATFLSEQVKVAFGTDSPVVDVNSMDVLYAAVTRQDPRTHKPQGGWLPQERITMADAIRAYTFGSAQAAGRADELGTLEAGKLADFAVLDKNLLTVSEDDIQRTHVKATYVGGQCVYELGDTLR
ncbi:MAG: amidohydrolase family protein [Raoultibacter sp.]